MSEKKELWFEYTMGELFEKPMSTGLFKLDASITVDEFDALMATFLGQVVEE